MKKSLAYRIVELLEEHGYEWSGGPENAKIRRTYAGRHQRSDGAWLWTLDTMTGTPNISVGSQWQATMVAHPKSEVSMYYTPGGSVEIFVDKDPNKIGPFGP